MKWYVRAYCAQQYKYSATTTTLRQSHRNSWLAQAFALLYCHTTGIGAIGAAVHTTTSTATATTIAFVPAANTAGQQPVTVKPSLSDVAATSDSETSGSETVATPALTAAQRKQLLQLTQQQQQQLQHWYDADSDLLSDSSKKMALVAVWDLPQGVTGAIQAKLSEFFTYSTSGVSGCAGYQIHDSHVTLTCSEQSAAALVAFPT
jgi:hypothetical protein